MNSDAKTIVLFMGFEIYRVINVLCKVREKKEELKTKERKSTRTTTPLKIAVALE